MNDERPLPRVGVAVIVINEGRVLIGKRTSKHGEGRWAFPGGHLEFGESLEECAARETMEECGLEIKNAAFYALTNDVFEDSGKHYITIFMRAEASAPSTLENREPHKCEGWDWFDWSAPPSPLFLPFENLLKQKLPPP